ncbi:MAG: dihydrodipicolinate synthase family protein [Thermoplasmata archaeon]
MHWKGVFPAVTTAFTEAGNVDLDFFTHHLRALVAGGCSGVVVLGSLSEAPALRQAEKVDILTTAKATLGSSVPVLSGVSASATAEAVAWAKEAVRLGADGLMVLPPYVYRGDARETALHFDAVFAATGAPVMLYNNPIAYGTDVPPAGVRALAERHPNLIAVKESSGDLRRFTELGLSAGRPLDRFVGIDDQIVEGIHLGAIGWIAGLANALPRESVRLFEAAQAHRAEEVAEIYRWFLPLLRMDAEPKFVQKIKLAQAEVGLGSARVRAPRRELIGAELESTRAAIRAALEHRPPSLR